MSGGWIWDEWSSNSYQQWIGSGNREAWVLSRPRSGPPGNAFTYNSGATHILGVLTDQYIDQGIVTYADQELFGPIGITQREWEMFTSGYPNGGAGIDLRDGIEIHNARLSRRNVDYADYLYSRLQRRGYLFRDCQRLA